MTTLIKDENGKPIGWKMSPTTEEEHVIVSTIRDLQFFGVDDTYPKYNGLELIDPVKGKVHGNIKKISWLQKKYHK